MNYYAGEPMHDGEMCECGSTTFLCARCPDTDKYLDQCTECGDCGSHLCDNIDCPSNEKIKKEVA